MSSFRTVNCEKHGDYEAEVTVAGSGQFEREFCADCPQCEKERVEQSIKETNHYRAGAEKSAFSKIKIPARYISTSISEITASNDDQQKIIDRCKSYVEKYDDLKKLGTSLIFTGKPGTGKTMIALSMVKPIIAKIVSPKYDKVIYDITNNGESGQEAMYCTEYDTFRYINTYDLFMEIKATYNKNSNITEREVIEKYTHTDNLILDEVGAQSGSDYEVTTMFRIINSRYENLKPTFLISNLSEEDLSEYIGERTIDRFYENHGAVFVFDWESYRRD